MDKGIEGCPGPTRGKRHHIFMNTFIRQASDRNNTDRQTDRIYTNVKKTLVKTRYICRKFVIDCLYSRELVTKTELAITSQRRNMNECNAHDNIRFLDVNKCL